MAIAGARQRRFRFQASGLSISRGGERILSNISLTLDPGEVIVLRGPNGAGKTTLLRALAGLLRMDAGAIEVTTVPDGAPANEENPVIYCGPLNATKAALSVDENLDFWAALYRAPAGSAAEARAAFGLDDYAARRAGALSTGLGRRLGLARLLIANKPIWFVDEPTASLDRRSAEIFTALVERHRAAGGAAIIATHDALDFDGARRMALAPEAAR
jgi:heme exporter protein A